MITNFAVGAEFKIVNQASPAIAKILAEMRVLNDVIKMTRLNLQGLSRMAGLTGLAGQFRVAATAAAGLNRAGAGMGTLNAGLARAVANANNLTAALGRAGAAGGGRLGGQFRGGPKVSGHGVAMGAMGALAMGIYEEAEIEDIAARALITGQIKIDSGMTQTAAFKKIRDVISRNASLGGFDPRQVGEAVLGSERQFAGLGFDKRMSVLNTMLPFAMQESRMKESSLKEAAEAMVGLSHMTGTYDTAKLPDLYRKFSYASQLTPKSITEYQRALSYAMPSLVGGMGMDPDAIMFLTAMNQSAGIGSSKAGTWIQAFFSKLMPATGTHLNKSQLNHNEALARLGLTDSSGGVSWLAQGPGGKTDWLASLMRLSPILGDKLAAMPDTARMQTIDQVFGKLGGREAGLFNLPEFIGQFPQLAKQLKMATGGEGILKQLTDASPVQQARNAWTDLKIVLMDISTTVLPPLTGALKIFDDTLKVIDSHLPQNATATGAEKGALIGAGLGWKIPGVGPGIGAAVGGFLGGMWGHSSESFDERLKLWGVGPGASRPTSDKGSTNLTGNVLMDGQKVGELVTGHQVNSMSGAGQGAGTFDFVRASAPSDVSWAAP
jgi:hypothetical protein